MGLGDVIERALSAVGVTKDRVEKWVGGPCGCAQRQERLNRLSAWASRILRGRTEHATKYLDSLMDGANEGDDKDKIP